MLFTWFLSMLTSHIATIRLQTLNVTLYWDFSSFPTRVLFLLQDPIQDPALHLVKATLGRAFWLLVSHCSKEARLLSSLIILYVHRCFPCLEMKNNREIELLSNLSCGDTQVNSDNICGMWLQKEEPSSGRRRRETHQESPPSGGDTGDGPRGINRDSQGRERTGAHPDRRMTDSVCESADIPVSK